MRQPPRLLAFALGVTLTAGTSACGSKSPTGPDGGSGGLTANIGIFIVNPGFAETLGRAQLFWDGTLIDDVSNTPPVSVIEVGGSVTASAGSHTLSFKLLSQTSSPFTYTVSGSVTAFDQQSSASQEVDIPSQNISVATGTTHSFTIVLH